MPIRVAKVRQKNENRHFTAQKNAEKSENTACFLVFLTQKQSLGIQSEHQDTTKSTSPQEHPQKDNTTTQKTQIIPNR